jgi:hypothetical protein
MKLTLPTIPPDRVIVDYDGHSDEILTARFDGISYSDPQIIPGDWLNHPSIGPRMHYQLRTKFRRKAEEFLRKNQAAVIRIHEQLNTNHEDSHWASTHLWRPF